MQDFIVYGIVLAAIAYLVWQTTRMARGKKSCGGCGGGCAEKKTQPTPLIQIQMGEPARRRISRPHDGSQN
jgi:hypothetical protein